MISEIISQLKEFEPEYEVTLPFSKNIVKYKPFKMKDQKNLSLTIQQKNVGLILQKICEIISNCSSEKNPELLHLCDLEYLFLNIRSKSVEEKIYIMIGDESPKKMVLEIDKIELKSGNSKQIIFINPKTSIELESPKVKDYFEMSSLDDSLLCSGAIKSVIINQRKYDLRLSKIKEIQTILDEISSENYNTIKQFVEQTPKLTYTLETDSGPVLLEGFLRFFI